MKERDQVPKPAPYGYYTIRFMDSIEAQIRTVTIQGKPLPDGRDLKILNQDDELIAELPGVLFWMPDDDRATTRKALGLAGETT